MFLSLIWILFVVNSVYNYNEKNKSFNSLRNSKLLVILVDGFRWDYVSRDKSLKGFPLIEKNGVHAQYVKPIFPSMSVPNWYSITTGLYAESHGMIDNNMYDNVRNEIFRLGQPEPGVNSESHWWNQTEPLWINAEKHGRRTSMYMWDGCEVIISGLRASRCLPYQDVDDPKEVERQTRIYINSILNDFSNNIYSLSMLYYGHVDSTGHSYGPNSIEVKISVKQIDAILYDLFKQIIDRKLDKILNVVIVSDHGMTDLKGFKEVFLNKSVDFNDIGLMLGSYAGSQIFPKSHKEIKVFNELSSIEGIKVYRKHKIPDEFHYKNNYLVPPIITRADIGYYIAPVKRGKLVTPPDNKDSEKFLLKGQHGYDPQLSDMRGIMHGFGPAFKKHFISYPLEMVDHYNLFCRLLCITPHPNNGTVSKVKPFLKG